MQPPDAFYGLYILHNCVYGWGSGQFAEKRQKTKMKKKGEENEKEKKKGTE